MNLHLKGCDSLDYNKASLNCQLKNSRVQQATHGATQPQPTGRAKRLTALEVLDMSDLSHVPSFLIVSNIDAVHNRVPEVLTAREDLCGGNSLGELALLRDRRVRDPVDIIVLGQQTEDEHLAPERARDLEIGVELVRVSERVGDNHGDFRAVAASADHLALVPVVCDPEQLWIEVIGALVNRVNEKVVRLEDASVLRSAEMVGEGGLAGARGATDDEHWCRHGLFLSFC